MADGVKARNTDRVLTHISPKFSAYGRDRSEFRGYVESRLGLVDDLVIWNIELPSGGSPAANGTLRVTFSAKPKGARLGTPPPFLVEASFVLDPDGQWRMKDFQVFNPIVDSHVPLPLP